MPKTHRITKKRYWHFLKYASVEAPKRDVSWTTEFSKPFRNGVGTARKFPFSKRHAIVFGRWVSKEEQAKVIVENELAYCERHMARTQKELKDIIGHDTYVQKYG